nr:phosphoserine phosphatase SerB [Candidatus Thioglobus sp.]
MNTFVLHSKDLTLAQRLATELQGELEERQSHFRVHTNLSADLEQLRELYGVDINLLSKTFNYSEVALMVSDMDSTLIINETI